MKQHPLISILIPVYNEAENLEWHHSIISKHMKAAGHKYELIYIDDGSTDSSLQLIKELSKGKETRYIALSRNFGKEAATSAGLANIKGDVALIMDADGQHPIEMLDTFMKHWQSGYEVIVGVRISNEGEGYIKRYGSKFFYKVLHAIGGRDVTPGSTDFCLLDNKVVVQFNSLTERNRVARDLISWLGYKRVEVPFRARSRHAGPATYSTRKLFALALNSLISHSTRPLKIVAVLGLFISTVSATAVIMLGAQKYLLGDPLGSLVTGSGILALFTSFLVGIVLVCQGLLALYLESVYYEAQNRPLFVIREQG